MAGCCGRVVVAIDLIYAAGGRGGWIAPQEVLE